MALRGLPTRRGAAALLAVGLAAVLVPSCSSSASSSTSQPSAPTASSFCGHVSQVLIDESTLVGIAPSNGIEHLGVSNSDLVTLEATARSLASNLTHASEQAPTSSLRKALSDLGLQVSSAVTFANPVATLQLKAQDAAAGLSPLYRSLGQLCPNVVSSQRPTFAPAGGARCQVPRHGRCRRGVGERAAVHAD